MLTYSNEMGEGQRNLAKCLGNTKTIPTKYKTRESVTQTQYTQSSCVQGLKVMGSK